MKKRKLLFVVSAGLFISALASCKGNDYKALNINYDEPKKESKATVEYSTEDALNDLEKYYMDKYDSENQSVKDEFFNKYQSIMATYCYKVSSTQDSSKIEVETKKKSIVSPKTVNQYYFEQTYQKVDGKVVQEFSIESTTRVSSGKATTIADIKIKDMLLAPKYEQDEFGFVTLKGYSKKATGSLKLMLTQDYTDQDTKNMNNSLYKMAFTTNGIFLSAKTIKAYTNEDKSYLYISLDEKGAEEDYSKGVFVSENGLAKCIWESCLFDKREEVYHMDYEYIDNDILTDSINTDGYTSLDKENIATVNSFKNYPDTLQNTSYAIAIATLIESDESLLALLSVTEGEFSAFKL